MQRGDDTHKARNASSQQSAGAIVISEFARSSCCFALAEHSESAKQQARFTYTIPMNTFVTHLESGIDGTRLDADRVQTVHQGRPLWVRYDLDGVRAAARPTDFGNRPPTLWRYRELLPLPFDCEPVTLGEGITPLLPCPRLGRELGLSRLFIKDESQLPTGSFKSRGMTAAVSMAQHFGLKRLAIPTAGNAGGADRKSTRLNSSHLGHSYAVF